MFLFGFSSCHAHDLETSIEELRSGGDKVSLVAALQLEYFITDSQGDAEFTPPQTQTDSRKEIAPRTAAAFSAGILTAISTNSLAAKVTLRSLGLTYVVLHRHSAAIVPRTMTATGGMVIQRGINGLLQEKIPKEYQDHPLGSVATNAVATVIPAVILSWPSFWTLGAQTRPDATIHEIFKGVRVGAVYGGFFPNLGKLVFWSATFYPINDTLLKKSKEIFDLENKPYPIQFTASVLSGTVAGMAVSTVMIPTDATIKGLRKNLADGGPKMSFLEMGAKLSKIGRFGLYNGSCPAMVNMLIGGTIFNACMEAANWYSKQAASSETPKVDEAKG